MVSRFLLTAAIVMIAACPSLLLAQEAEAESLTLAGLRRERQRAQGDKQLTDEQRAAVLEEFDGAIQALESEADLASDIRRHEQEKSSAQREIDSLRRELDRATPEVPRTFSEDAPMAVIDQNLIEERAELAARQRAWRQLQTLAQSRAQRRTEIGQRIGELRHGQEAINDQLLALSQQETRPRLNTARLTRLQAESREHGKEVEALRSELTLLAIRSELLPLRLDRAQRRVAESSVLVAQLEDWALRAKRAEVEKELSALRAQCEAAEEMAPALGELTTETSHLGEQLWGNGGVVVEQEAIARRTTETRQRITEARSLAQTTRRKFEAVHLHGIAAQWWPQIPEDFPSSAELQNSIRERERLIPNIQHDLIVLGERQVETGNIEKEVRSWIDKVRQDDESQVNSELERTVRSLVGRRRELLGELIQQKTVYADSLLELTAANRDLLATTTDLHTYLWERMLFVRSVPGPKIPPLGDISGGIRWLFLNPEWGTVLRGSTASVFTDPWLVLGLGIFLLLLYSRRRVASALVRTGHAKSHGSLDILKALALTVVMSAPVPLILLWFGRFLEAAPESEVARGVSSAFTYTGLAAAGLAFMLNLVQPRGVGTMHLELRSPTAKLVRRELRWLIAVALPLAFVQLAVGEEGLLFHSSPDLRSYSNGLGRTCFILLVMAVVVTVYRIYRFLRGDSSGDRPPGTDMRAVGVRLGLFSLVLVAAAMPALLAALGYYVTGFLLFYKVVVTGALTLLLAVIGALLIRWRLARKNESPSTRIAGVRRTVHFGLGMVWLIGLLVIWFDLVPAFRVLQNIRVWPTIELLEETDEVAGAPSVEGQQPDVGRPVTGSQTVQAPGSQLLTTSPESPEANLATTDIQSSDLRLSNILQMLLMLVFTVILGKNIPALLEFVLHQRTAMEAGVRLAFTTLVRYVIAITGVSLAAASLGLTWQKIQWLVAALTVGLGFGLQEIFANFVAGIIILLDRPIRVGDVVTIGDVGGWVTRMSIRTTVITKWDRSELIVPNKDLITSQVINWTLSNQLTRVELKVGVAYGSDVELVRKVLLEVAHNHPAILKDPPPYVVLMEFGASSVDFELRVYVNYQYGRLTIRDEVQRAIVKAFRENDITIAFPQLDLHVRSGGAEPVLGTPRQLRGPAGQSPRGLQEDDG